MSARITNAQVMAELAEIRALLSANAPAKADPKPARRVAPKARARKAPNAPALPKGVRTTRAAGGTLSRKDWNRTVTTKARFMGGPAYAWVLANWANAQEQRALGTTPDEFIAWVAAQVG